MLSFAEAVSGFGALSAMEAVHRLEVPKQTANNESKATVEARFVENLEIDRTGNLNPWIGRLKT